jgi:facilitated trehalose transporter
VIFPVVAASLAPLGALFGSLLASYPMARFGRKMTLRLSAVLFLFAFLLMGTCKETESMVAILVARGFMGFSVGLSMPAAQIYVSHCGWF